MAKGKRRYVRIAIAFVAVVASAIAAQRAYELGYTVTGYVAKQACSLVNVCGQPMEDVLEELREDNPFIKYSDVDYDDATGATRVSILGLFKSTAVYRPPLGATLVYPEYEDKIESFPSPAIPGNLQAGYSVEPFVESESEVAGLDYDALEEAYDYAFGEPGSGATRRTRALVVVQRDRIVAERYAEGYSRESVHLSWSMSKSILNLAIGRRAYLGGLSIEETKLRPEWLGDERANIRARQLLRMESGLEFDESYAPFSDSINMLYRAPDMAAYAASLKAVAEPGHQYDYSSGSSNILSAWLRGSFRNDSEYIRFLWDDFLRPLGVGDCQLEFDSSGTWVASSYMYATALDWARFGRLVLEKGVWRGERFLPEGWIEESTAPTPSYQSVAGLSNPPGASYGMQWWLNREDGKGRRWLESAPEDTVIAWGHFGQFLTIIPSKDLIIARFGLSKGRGSWSHDRFLELALRAIP